MKRIHWATSIAGFLLMTSLLAEKRAAAQIYYITPASPAPGELAPSGEYNYDEAMRLGYAASKVGNYQAALTYFRNALTARPADRLATIAYWNMADRLNQGNSRVTSKKSDYERYMNIGYTATRRRDYQTALINFRRALSVRPNDRYANQAIRNVTTYLQAARQAQR
jgi:tetratricopeptide (TPR) repeat protein